MKAYSENYREFLKEVDAVYVASPHLSHYQYTKDALLEGKHVLCEIPFTLNGEQGKQVAFENCNFIIEGKKIIDAI